MRSVQFEFKYFEVGTNADGHQPINLSNVLRSPLNVGRGIDVVFSTNSDSLNDESQLVRPHSIDSRVIDPELLKLELQPEAIPNPVRTTSDQSLLSSPRHSDKKDQAFPNFPQSVDIPTNHPPTSLMPHRVEPYPMTSSNHSSRLSYSDDAHRRPSPPPIATLTHSPSPSLTSLDRSSASTPSNRRTPPHALHSAPLYPGPYSQSGRFSQDNLARPYMYASHQQYDHHQQQQQQQQQQQRYDSADSQDHSPYHGPTTLPHLTVPSMQTNPGRDSYGSPYPLPGQNNPHIIHTDDASTKLNDRVRRRCFNCCTTDTSTWRRSNLSPGKVLCNKCGLFERTHSRPRPDQFPHKRGPLAISNLRSRTPPVTHLPPISPPHFPHPSIAPLNNVQDTRRDYQSTTLPGLQSWHDSGSMQVPPTARRTTLEPNPHGRAPSPPPPRAQQQQQQHTPQEPRDTPAVRDPAP